MSVASFDGGWHLASTTPSDTAQARTICPSGQYSKAPPDCASVWRVRFARRSYRKHCRCLGWVALPIA
jgi:hypothetical protein